MVTDLLAGPAGALEKRREGGSDGVLRCESRDEALVAASLEEALPLAGSAAVVVTPGAPACTGPLYELARRAARAGGRVERLYLLPEPALAADDMLARHVARGCSTPERVCTRLSPGSLICLSRQWCSNASRLDG